MLQSSCAKGSVLVLNVRACLHTQRERENTVLGLKTAQEAGTREPFARWGEAGQGQAWGSWLRAVAGCGDTETPSVGILQAVHMCCMQFSACMLHFNKYQEK